MPRRKSTSTNPPVETHPPARSRFQPLPTLLVLWSAVWVGTILCFAVSCLISFGSGDRERSAAHGDLLEAMAREQPTLAADAVQRDASRLGELYRHLGELLDEETRRKNPVVTDGQEFLFTLHRIGHLAVGPDVRVQDRYPETQREIAKALSVPPLADGGAFDESCRKAVGQRCAEIAARLGVGEE